MGAGTKRAKLEKRDPKSETRKIPQEGRGLWIDHQLLRRHMSPLPKFVESSLKSDQSNMNRYLELADTLLKAEDHQEENS